MRRGAIPASGRWWWAEVGPRLRNRMHGFQARSYRPRMLPSIDIATILEIPHAGRRRVLQLSDAAARGLSSQPNASGAFDRLVSGTAAHCSRWVLARVFASYTCRPKLDTAHSSQLAAHK